MIFRRFFAGILLGSFLGVLPMSYIFHAFISEEQVFAQSAPSSTPPGPDIINCGGSLFSVDPGDGQSKKCCGTQLVNVNNICLLEGIPGTSDYYIDGSSTTSFETSAAFQYLQGGAFRWILRIGIGICVLNGAIGGMKIVMSGLDGSGTEEGKSKLIWSLVGLIIFLLAGTILNYINPEGFSI